MAAELVDDDAIASRLESLEGWERVGDKLRREFTFGNFTEAFGFMASVALIAERLFHHPEWSNVWNRVTIEITNHDAGGITDLDFEFAEKVNSLL